MPDADIAPLIFTVPLPNATIPLDGFPLQNSTGACSVPEETLTEDIEAIVQPTSS